jgi:hypothetical protein
LVKLNYVLSFHAIVPKEEVQGILDKFCDIFGVGSQQERVWEKCLKD